MRRVADEAQFLIWRDGTSRQPNRLWVSGLTEIRTAQGKTYLCIIKDLHDRMVVVWRTGPCQIAELVTTTIDRAALSRFDGERPFLHSDHGCQHTNEAYRDCLEPHDLTKCMDRVQTCAVPSAIICFDLQTGGSLAGLLVVKSPENIHRQ